MVPDVNEEIPVPAFEYFVETTRAFLNMAQNDTFTTPNMLAFVVPAGDYEKEAALLTELESRREIDHAVGLANTEAMDGYMLADKLTPRQFLELAGLDYEMAQVVYAAHMVVMYMCQQYGVQRFEGQRHQLLAYVRTAIYQHSCCVCLYQRHTTRALVAWVVAAAYLAVASKRRHST